MVAAGVAVAAGDIYNCGQMTGVYLDPADAWFWFSWAERIAPAHAPAAAADAIISAFQRPPDDPPEPGPEPSRHPVRGHPPASPRPAPRRLPPAGSRRSTARQHPASVAVGVEEEFHTVGLRTRRLAAQAGHILEQLPWAASAQNCISRWSRRTAALISA